MLKHGCEEEKQLILGQCLAQTLSLANREGNETSVSLHLTSIIEKSVRSEHLSLTPVVSLHHLSEHCQNSCVGRDQMTVDHEITGCHVLDSHGDNVGVSLYLHDHCLSVGKIGSIMNFDMYL